MTNPMIRIHNLETNEIIDRQMTDIEFADYKNRLAAEAAAETEAAAARQALLDKLGITEDEAKLLLS